VLSVAIDLQLADDIHFNQVEDEIKIRSRMDSSIRSEAYSKQMVRYEQCHELNFLAKTLQKLNFFLPLGFAFNQQSSSVLHGHK
jgi:type II secretory ATPase GspE/PulE/Tfp pilus assembly ATPase PilB-like protein